jgi:hypothetical protein
MNFFMDEQTNAAVFPKTLSQLIDRRSALGWKLAASLECSTAALVHNDAAAILHGTREQSELCRQWSAIENELRRRVGGRFLHLGPDFSQYADLKAEWDAIGLRLRYVTRVHAALLRHREHTLGILSHQIDRYAPTYTAHAGRSCLEFRLPKGISSCQD